MPLPVMVEGSDEDTCLEKASSLREVRSTRGGARARAYQCIMGGITTTTGACFVMKRACRKLKNSNV